MSFLLDNKKIELNNMTDKNNIVCNIKMDLTKLSKTELLVKCEENGIKKCKSKNREQLIALLEIKHIEKKKVKLIIEDDENLNIAENFKLNLVPFSFSLSTSISQFNNFEISSAKESPTP